jgi:hypothetical protein
VLVELFSGVYMKRYIYMFLVFSLCGASVQAGVKLKPVTSNSGYLARILLNEVPFPGESGWVSEADTKAAMLSILWVLHSRIEYVPAGYRQSELAATTTKDIIDVITVGGVHGQCEGFYRNKAGKPVMVSRVTKRIDNLQRIANTGKPGRFARLMNYAQGLADAYYRNGIKEADKFANIHKVGGVYVTGRAYSWMTDRSFYHPGGDFIKIPDALNGSLGGNRFSTLKKRK